MRVAIALIVLVLLGGCTKHTLKERDYQARLCDRLDGVMEYRLKDGARVDCLNDTYAIEVEFAKKWAEAAGQSLYYAAQTGRKPAVGFILRDTPKDHRRLARLRVLARRYAITIITLPRGD
jgi:hypothetical protein